MEKLEVRFGFDRETEVWVTDRSEVPGLTVENGTRDGLLSQVQEVTPELLLMSVGSGRIEAGNAYEIQVSEWPLDWARSDESRQDAASLARTFVVEVPQLRAAE